MFCDLRRDTSTFWLQFACIIDESFGEFPPPSVCTWRHAHSNAARLPYLLAKMSIWAVATSDLVSLIVDNPWPYWLSRSEQSDCLQSDWFVDSVSAWFIGCHLCICIKKPTMRTICIHVRVWNNYGTTVEHCSSHQNSLNFGDQGCMFSSETSLADVSKLFWKMRGGGGMIKDCDIKLTV